MLLYWCGNDVNALKPIFNYKKNQVYCHLSWHAVWHRPEGFPGLIPIWTGACHLEKKQSFLISVNPCVNIRFCSCLHVRQVLLVQHSGHAPNQDLYFHTVCSEELRSPLAIISSLIGWMSRGVGFHQHISISCSIVSGSHLWQFWLWVYNTLTLCVWNESSSVWELVDMDWPEGGKMPVAQKNYIMFLPSKKIWVNLVKCVFLLSPKTFSCFSKWSRKFAWSRAGGVPLWTPRASVRAAHASLLCV